MRRTQGRPVATGRVRPRDALLGGAAGVAAGLALALRVDGLFALHSLIGALTYVVVYTRILKRHTPQGVVVGGWTGAAAVLAGWEAGGGPLTPTGLALAAVVFLWTPAHFWGLALARVEEYRAAGVPVLPVVAGARATVLALASSAAATFAAAAVPLAIGELGAVYAAGLLVGAVLLGRPVVALVRAPTAALAWRTYLASNLVLLLLFTSALLDRALGGP
jgi:protoheme IX farnesyltransferase